MTERPVHSSFLATGPSYMLTLRPLPGVDAIRALRWILKSVLRQHGMRCTSIEEIKDHAGPKSRARELRLIDGDEAASSDQGGTE
jgi:hypothetical protein